MRLVKLIAPPDGCDFIAGEKRYAIGANRDVDVPENMVPGLLAEGWKRAEASQVVLMQGPKGDMGLEGKQGEIGPRGPAGPRGEIGPMPRHEWDGTSLRFEIEPGRWGALVDLQGPKGEDGRDSTGGQTGIFGGGPIDLSGIVAGGSTNSYFPSGW